MDESDEHPRVPAPPPFPRKVEIVWPQIVGIGLLALLPIVALTGALGDDERLSQLRSGPLSLEVRYPPTMRFSTSRAIEVRLRNDGATTLQRVRIAFDDAYLSRFSETQFAPEASRFDDEWTSVQFAGLRAGEARRIVVTLRAEKLGLHRGRIRVAIDDDARATARDLGAQGAEDRRSAAIEIASVVLP